MAGDVPIVTVPMNVLLPPHGKDDKSFAVQPWAWSLAVGE